MYLKYANISRKPLSSRLSFTSLQCMCVQYPRDNCQPWRTFFLNKWTEMKLSLTILYIDSLTIKLSITIQTWNLTNRNEFRQVCLNYELSDLFSVNIAVKMSIYVYIDAQSCLAGIMSNCKPFTTPHAYDRSNLIKKHTIYAVKLGTALPYIGYICYRICFHCISSLTNALC